MRGSANEYRCPHSFIPRAASQLAAGKVSVGCKVADCKLGYILGRRLCPHMCDEPYGREF